jgi:5-aminolevulinate synthase
MGQHPNVICAMVETAIRMGTGAGGTRNIAGTSHPLVELEHELADLHGKEAALMFTSGYVSNQTGIATIARLMSGLRDSVRRAQPQLDDRGRAPVRDGEAYLVP